MGVWHIRLRGHDSKISSCLLCYTMNHGKGFAELFLVPYEKGHGLGVYFVYERPEAVCMA